MEGKKKSSKPIMVIKNVLGVSWCKWILNILFVELGESRWGQRLRGWRCQC